MLIAISILVAFNFGVLLGGMFRARVRRLQSEQQQLDERLDSVINPKDHL